MTTWDKPDYDALNLLHAGLGDFHVLEVIQEENRMTDVANPEMPIPAEDWGQEPEDGAAYGGTTYPQYPDNPHNHRFTISVDGRGPMIVVRGNTAQEVRAGFEELTTGGAAAAAQAAFQAFKGAPAPQAPAQGYAPQGGQPNFNPVTPPPNQPFPGQPAWQQAGAPQAQAAPAWGGGGGQQGGGGNGKPQPKPCPPGWYRTDKNSGPGADFWKGWREQNQQALKGKIQWGGASTFWVAPDVAPMVSGAGFVVVSA